MDRLAAPLDKRADAALAEECRRASRRCGLDFVVLEDVEMIAVGLRRRGKAELGQRPNCRW